MEAIARRVPVDRMAAIVTSGQTQIVFKPRPFWLEMPDTIEPPDGLTNLIGVSSGSLVVVGYFGLDPRTKSSTGLTRRTSERHKWIIKCDCGRYELRNHRKTQQMRDKDREKYSKCSQCFVVSNKVRCMVENNSISIE